MSMASSNQKMFCSGAWRIFVLAVLLGTLVTSLRADDLATGFDSANKLYAEGKFSEAASAYDALLAGGNVSEAIYFNRGNALFKAGQVGRAIASYRQAELLAPRDSTLRANLQLARTRARGGSMYHGNRWVALVSWLGLNEWAVLLMAAFWVLFILLAVGQWRPEFKASVRSYVWLAGGAFVVFFVCLGTMHNEYRSPSAIVVVGETEVRNGPLEESPGIFKVRDGAELEVTDQKDGWLQVIDVAQRMGWVRQDQVILLEQGKARSGKS
jgi:tetratricopeptide (TPR) repeat protein